MIKSLFITIVFLVNSVAFSQTVNSGHVEAELISEVESIQPGKPFWTAVRLKMDPHWHTYWQYPGDTGLSTKIEWNLPEGFVHSEINWPYPEVLVIGGLANYGYENETLLLIKITPPNIIKVTLNLNGEWLVCKEECVPESAGLNLTLPVKRIAFHN
ncbi:MAG: protein-disulfide reductase DsbD family protein [Ignavibacteria bacterium]|jgi:thiol:disulfide interchange protein DsbD